MKLSVIIPCTRPVKVIRALKAFRNQAGNIPFEVLVCGENVEFDPCGAFKFINIECDTSHVNRARNKGIAHSQGSIIAFLDDDSIPDEGWLNQALSIDPDSSCVFTGPEKAYSEQEGSEAIERIYQTVSRSFVEGAWGHFRDKPERVAYSDIPFCNLVIPRILLDRVSPLSTHIPWDMDDFHFCHSLLGKAEFWNDPLLKIIHDRYPSNALTFLKNRFFLRKRTGEKLISHTKYYGSFLSLWIALAIPWIAILTLILFPFPALIAFVIFVLLWLIRTLIIHRKNSFRERIARFLLETALTSVTIIGYQCGLFCGLYNRAKNLTRSQTHDNEKRDSI